MAAILQILLKNGTGESVPLNSQGNVVGLFL